MISGSGIISQFDSLSKILQQKFGSHVQEAAMHQRIAELEKSEAERKRMEEALRRFDMNPFTLKGFNKRTLSLW